VVKTTMIAHESLLRPVPEESRRDANLHPAFENLGALERDLDLHPICPLPSEDAPEAQAAGATCALALEAEDEAILRRAVQLLGQEALDALPPLSSPARVRILQSGPAQPPHVQAAAAVPPGASSSSLSVAQGVPVVGSLSGRARHAREADVLRILSFEVRAWRKIPEPFVVDEARAYLCMHPLPIPTLNYVQLNPEASVDSVLVSQAAAHYATTTTPHWHAAAHAATAAAGGEGFSPCPPAGNTRRFDYTPCIPVPVLTRAPVGPCLDGFGDCIGDGDVTMVGALEVSFPYERPGAEGGDDDEARTDADTAGDLSALVLPVSVAAPPLPAALAGPVPARMPLVPEIREAFFALDAGCDDYLADLDAGRSTSTRANGEADPSPKLQLVMVTERFGIDLHSFVLKHHGLFRTPGFAMAVTQQMLLLLAELHFHGLAVSTAPHAPIFLCALLNVRIALIQRSLRVPLCQPAAPRPEAAEPAHRPRAHRLPHPAPLRHGLCAAPDAARGTPRHAVHHVQVLPVC
jgi:hypothetical protein